VVGGAPGEEEGGGGDVEFLEEAVDDPAVGGSVEGGEIGLFRLSVNGYQCCSLGRYAELVEVAEDVAVRFDCMDDVVGGVELSQFSSCQDSQFSKYLAM